MFKLRKNTRFGFFVFCGESFLKSTEFWINWNKYGQCLELDPSICCSPGSFEREVKTFTALHCRCRI